jgi:hypothetical protein
MKNEEIAKAIQTLAQYCYDRQEKDPYNFCNECELHDICYSENDFVLSELKYR